MNFILSFCSYVAFVISIELTDTETHNFTIERLSRSGEYEIDDHGKNAHLTWTHSCVDM